jgi:hypothetical protein
VPVETRDRAVHVAALLETLFTSTDEVYAFLREQPSGRDLTNALPSRDVSMREYCLAAGEQLDAQGRITAGLFEHLVQARPRREADIREVSHALPVDDAGQPDANRPTDPPPVAPGRRRTLWIGAASVLLAATLATAAFALSGARTCEVAALPPALRADYDDLARAAQTEADAGNWCAASDLAAEAVTLCDGDRAFARRAREWTVRCE